MPRSRSEITLPVRLAEGRRRETLRLLKAAEAAEAWSAVTGLVLQLRKADEEVAKAKAKEELEKGKEKPLTPTEAAARLQEMVSQAPLAVQGRIFRDLATAHPDWLESGAWDDE